MHHRNAQTELLWQRHWCPSSLQYKNKCFSSVAKWLVCWTWNLQITVSSSTLTTKLECFLKNPYFSSLVMPGCKITGLLPTSLACVAIWTRAHKAARPRKQVLSICIKTAKLRSLSTSGIICGSDHSTSFPGPFPLLGSFAVQFGDHLQSGIISGAVQVALAKRFHRIFAAQTEKFENATGKENLQKRRVVLLGDNCQ